MDVCIIGAGWSGLYACKYALENGLRPIVLERRDDIGGVWNYSDDPAITTVMKSTVSSSSRLVTEASDFFMDESVGHFMHHRDVMDYLRSYVRHFGLADYIRFRSTVTEVKKLDGRWQIAYEQGGVPQIVLVDRLVVCAGLHNRQKSIGEPVSDFSGSVQHSGSLKDILPSDFTADDRVIVYGGGETASDLIDLLVATPAQITWAIRGGQHFLRKTLFRQRAGIGQFGKHDFALDIIASPLLNGISSFSKSAPGRRYITDWLSTGSVKKYQGHGVPIWRNRFKYAQAFFNKNGHVVDYVHSGRVIPENEIVEVNGSKVTFGSGNSGRYTHIVCCFGYEFECAFLPDKYRHGKLENLYQFVFPADDTTIAFLGFTRPIIGSIPLMTEAQALWALRVLSGKVQLPSEKTLIELQRRNNEKWDRRLPGRGNLRTLVLPSTYVAMMLKEAYPQRSPGDHFWRHPMRALKFLSWIPSGSIWRALDPELDRQTFNRLWRQRSHGFFLAYMLPILVLFSQALQIERIIDWYVDRQYQKETKQLAAKAQALSFQSEDSSYRPAKRRAA